MNKSEFAIGKWMKGMEKKMRIQLGKIPNLRQEKKDNRLWGLNTNVYYLDEKHPTVLRKKGRRQVEMNNESLRLIRMKFSQENGRNT